MGGTSQDEQGSHSMDAAARMETTGGGRMGDDGAALGLRRGRIGLRLKLITYPLSD